MEIIIHRGTKQIGGCSCEIRTAQSRIFLDFGADLEGEEQAVNKLQVNGVNTGTPNADAVFFSHYHGDHIGLLQHIFEGIPLYMGTLSKQIFFTLQKRLQHINSTPNITRLESIQTFEPGQSITIKDIKITPYFTDHSAYDAYMFLIEAENKRILYTGDFRDHGYLHKSIDAICKYYAKNIDIIITEGTNILRCPDKPQTENELSSNLANIFKQHKYTFLLCSSTNIDRIAAAHKALQGKQMLIGDTYQKDIIELVKQHPQSSSLYKKIQLYNWGENLIPYIKENGCCFLIRHTQPFLKIIEQLKENGIQGKIIYSMWKGYIEKSSELKNFLGNDYICLHTSGHASAPCIKNFCETVNPKTGIIPIHTETPQAFRELLPNHNIIFLDDKKVYHL